MPARKKRPITVAVIGPDNAGWYHAWYQVGIKNNGKPDRRHRRGRTAVEVEDKIRVLEDKYAAGAVEKAGTPITVATWLRQWLDTTTVTRLKYNTVKVYRTNVTEHLIPHLGAHRLDRLEAEHVDAMYKVMAKRKRKPATVHQAYRVLRTALGVAVKREKCSRNAAAIAGPPALEEDEVSPLTVAEAKRIVGVAEHRRNGVRWALAVSLGVRQGEALALLWKHVDLDAGTVTIQRKAYRRSWQHGCKNPAACAKRKCRVEPCRKIWEHGCPTSQRCRFTSAFRCPQRRPGDRCPRHLRSTCPPPCPTGCTGHASTCPEKRDGGIYYESPKTSRSRRVVSLPGPLVEALRAHRRRQREDKMAARNTWVDNDLVFAGPFGEPVDARRDWQDWRDLLAEANVPPTKVHTARHTAATLLLVMGVDPRTVMDIMGWSQRAMLTRYQHVVDELRQEAAKRVGEALWGPALSPDPSPQADVGRSS